MVSNYAEKQKKIEENLRKEREKLKRLRDKQARKMGDICMKLGLGEYSDKQIEQALAAAQAYAVDHFGEK